MTRRRITWIVVSTLAVAAAIAASTAGPVAAGPADAGRAGFLKTPSGSVYCDYHYGGTRKPFPYVRCGFKTGLVPPERKPRKGCGDVDFVGNRMILRQTGRGQTEPCAGDAGPFSNPREAHTVPYGKTWHGGPFSCTASRAGMTCRNGGGHGFFIAHRHWRTF